MQGRKRLTNLLKKASRLLKVPILVARVRKSINIQRLKKFLLLKHHYNYRYSYVHEYQFYRRPAATKKRRYRNLYSNFPIRNGGEYRGGVCPLMELKALPAASACTGEEERLYDDKSLEISGELDEDSIDERAEKFIERFYEEIRMQRL